MIRILLHLFEYLFICVDNIQMYTQQKDIRYATHIAVHVLVHIRILFIIFTYTAAVEMCCMPEAN